MKILSYNPGHDGAFAYVEDGCLVFSIEAEKSSRYRHSSISVPDATSVLRRPANFAHNHGCCLDRRSASEILIGPVD